MFARRHMIAVSRVATMGVLSLALAALGGAQAWAPPQTAQVDPFRVVGLTAYAQDQVVVAFRAEVTERQRQTFLRQFGLTRDRSQANPYFDVLLVPQSARRAGVTVESVVRGLQNHPFLRWAEFNPVLEKDYTPNDTRFGEMWGLNNTGQSGGTADADIDAVEAWDTAWDHPEILVAVIDDGFELSHEDLANQVWNNPGENPTNGIDDDGNGFIDDKHGWDVGNNDNNINPDSAGDSHGTHCTGTIAAQGDNGRGVVGVAPNAKFMGLKIFGATPYWTAMTRSVDYAWQNGAKVISVSYNTDGFTNAFVEALQRAEAADMVYVGSAGNNGQTNPPRQQMRLLVDNIIFVAATDRRDRFAGFSNRGTLIDIAAPGVDILSTVTGNSYANFSGTSMACPHVAGAAAVLRSLNPDLTARETLDILIETADSVDALASGIPDGKRLNLASAVTGQGGGPAFLLDVETLIGLWMGGDTGSVDEDDNNRYQVAGELIDRTGRYAAIGVTFEAPESDDGYRRLSGEISAMATATGVSMFVQAWNVNSGRWDTISTHRLRTTETLYEFEFSAIDVPNYVSAERLVRFRVMGFQAVRGGRLQPIPFQLMIDHMTLNVR